MSSTDLADPADLELSIAEMRAMLDVASTRVLDHLGRVGSQPAVGDTDAEDLCASMREPAPERGVELTPLLDSFFDQWMPRSLTTNGPGYLAYVPGGGIFPATIADLVSNTTNRFAGEA